MRILVLIFAALLFFLTLLIGLLRYPVKVRLVRRDGEFSATLSYLFYHKKLTDTAHPIDPRDFRKGKWKKLLLSLARTKKRKKKRRFRFKRSGAASPNRLRPFFYLRLTVLLLRTLGAEHVPHLRIAVSRLALTYGTERPDLTAILHGSIACVCSYTLSAFSRIARLSLPEDAISLTPVFHEPTFDLSFDISLSLSLLYYLSVFHALVPNNERVLRALAKRKEKSDRKRLRAKKSKRGFTKWRKAISATSSAHP